MEALISRIQESAPFCEKDLNQLLAECDWVFSGAISQYLKKGSGCARSEIEGSKHRILFQAVMKFNPAGGLKFSTFLWNAVKFQCFNSVFNNRLSMTDELLEDVLEGKSFSEADSPVEAIEKTERAEVLKKAVESLKDENARKIVWERYFGDPDRITPWSEVCKKFTSSKSRLFGRRNFSPQYCWKVHQEAMPALREHLSENA